MSVFAQRDPSLAHYYANMLLYNPAYAGSNKNIDITTIVRKQWAGFNNSPTTEFLSVHKPINHESIGIGMHVMHEILGAENHLTLNFAYAYRINLANGVLSGGLQLGMEQFNLDADKLDPFDLDDPLIRDLTKNNFSIDFGSGLYYQGNNLFISISAMHLIKTSFNSLLNRPLHLYFGSGYNYVVNEDFSLKPSVFTKFIANTPLQMDFTLRGGYKNAITVGAGYSTSNTLLFISDFYLHQITKKIYEDITIGYAFELPIGNSPRINASTHELFLNYNFKPAPNPKKLKKRPTIISPRVF